MCLSVVLHNKILSPYVSRSLTFGACLGLSLGKLDIKMAVILLNFEVHLS